MYQQTFFFQNFPPQPPFEKFLDPRLNHKRQIWSPLLALITTQTNDDGNFFWWEIIGKIQTFLVCHNYYTRDRIGLTSREDGKHIDISGKDNKATNCTQGHYIRLRFILALIVGERILKERAKFFFYS